MGKDLNAVPVVFFRNRPFSMFQQLRILLLRKIFFKEWGVYEDNHCK